MQTSDSLLSWILAASDLTIVVLIVTGLISLILLPRSRIDKKSSIALICLAAFIFVNATYHFVIELIPGLAGGGIAWGLTFVMLVCAVASLVTVRNLWPLLLAALASRKTQDNNRALREALAENQRLSQQLEQGVADRTAELEALNARLAAREAHYRQLYQSTPVMMHLVNEGGLITDVSDYWVLRMGYKPDQAIGQSPEVFLAEEHIPTTAMPISNPFADDDQRMVTLQCYQTRDGDLIEVEQTTVPDLDVSGAPRWHSILVDVTQRNQAYRALEAKSNSLERANNSLRQFAYIASHDLQEPLRKIASFTDFLRLAMESGEEDEIRYAMDVLSNAAVRARALVSDLLTYSRISNQDLDLQSIDLLNVVEGIATEFGESINEIDCELEIDVVPLMLEADGAQVRSLLSNLVGNAIKYRAEQRRPKVSVTGARASDTGDYLLRVQDNGIGFDQKFAEMVFEPFRRLHGQTKIRGTGIGLAICRAVAERHGWGLSATSEVGVGSTFTITFPANAAPPDPSAHAPLVMTADQVQ